MINISNEELYWLAGILEGEGTFYSNRKKYGAQPIIRLCMTDKDIVERVSKLWGDKAIHKIVSHNPMHKDQWSVKLCGQECSEWLIILRPIMGIRRSQRIDEMIEENSKRLGRHARGTEVAISVLDETKVKYIRREYKKRTMTDISRKLDVAYNTVWSVVSGRTWKHVA